MTDSSAIAPFPTLLATADEPPSWRASLTETVAGLHFSREVSHNIRHRGRIRSLPSSQALLPVLDKLAAAMFPTHYGRADLNPDMIDTFVDLTLDEALTALEDQVRREMRSALRDDDVSLGEADAKTAEIIRAFAAQLPAIRNLIVSDLLAAYAGDPAATSYPEIMLSYPGMTALLHHRIARALYLLDATLVARLIAQIAHAKTAVDIHPGAQIGSSFFIDHGTGVVIGETAVIGERVRIYQAVTLGAKRFPADENGRLVKGKARHPIVENDVVIYAGATILGRITIGHHSVVGGNVWLTQSIPAYSNVTQAQTRKDEA